MILRTDRFTNCLVAVFTSLALTISVPVNADYAFEFVRVACVPEGRLLLVDFRTINSEPVDAPAVRGSSMDTLRALAAQGMYEPRSLRQECKLPSGTYVLTAEQADASATGMCGAAPQIRVSLRRDEKILIHRVNFGSSCFQEPVITQITVGDGGIEEGRDGYYRQQFTICTSRGDGASIKCTLRSGESVNRFWPLHQQGLEGWERRN